MTDDVFSISTKAPINQASGTSGAHLLRVTTGAGRDLTYLLLGIPLAIGSFMTLLPAILISGLLLVTVLGQPSVALTLFIARAFALAERFRLGILSGEIPAHPVSAGAFRQRRRWPEAVRQLQLWLDLAHGLVRLPVTTLTGLLAVTWSLAALTATTYGAWSWTLAQPPQDTFADLLGLSGRAADVAVTTAFGVVFLLTLPLVLRGCVLLETKLVRLLLMNARLGDAERQVRRLIASRNAAMEAEVVGLRRLERDLHDGPQQRLVRISMDLQTVLRRLDDDLSAARTIVSEAAEHTHQALAELRALSRGIAPPLLSDRGLVGALAAVASHCTVPVELVDKLDGVTLPARVENTVYFVVAEALTNVAKHSRAGRCSISIQMHDEQPTKERTVHVVIVDDGDGGAHTAKGHGLAGLLERVKAVEGRLQITSPPGGPTRLKVELPCG